MEIGQNLFCPIFISMEGYTIFFMNIAQSQNDINKQTALTSGAGAVAGGLSAWGVHNMKMSALAKNMTESLSDSPASYDAFVRKNKAIVSKALNSKKGFFGKLNNALRKTNNTKTFKENVKEQATILFDKYNTQAKEALKLKGVKQPLENEVAALENKYIARDIKKSFKNVSKLKTAAKIAGFAAVGAVMMNVLREVAVEVSTKRLIKKTENEIILEQLKSSKEASYNKDAQKEELDNKLTEKEGKNFKPKKVSYKDENSDDKTTAKEESSTKKHPKAPLRSMH